MPLSLLCLGRNVPTPLGNLIVVLLLPMLVPVLTSTSTLLPSSITDAKEPGCWKCLEYIEHSYLSYSKMFEALLLMLGGAPYLSLSTFLLKVLCTLYLLSGLAIIPRELKICIFPGLILFQIFPACSKLPPGSLSVFFWLCRSVECHRF